MQKMIRKDKEMLNNCIIIFKNQYLPIYEVKSTLMSMKKKEVLKTWKTDYNVTKY